MKIHILSLLFVLISPSVFALSGTVIAVQDGDTMTIVDSKTKEKVRIRLMGVDTPELHFFGESQGQAAQDACDVLREITPRGTFVRIGEDYQTDKHGRILGRVFKTDGLDVNAEMLRRGLGVLYFIYPFSKRALTEYSKAAYEGYQAKAGIFSGVYIDLELPYDFRMSVRGMDGFNLVGDIETKRLFRPKDVQEVPVWKRVFFHNQKAANSAGYSFSFL